MSELNIGLVTDSHFSEFDNAIAAILKESNLSAVIHLGDTVSDRKASIKQQTKEIMQSILTFESIGIPIFWLPGNIEKYSAYKTAFSNLAKEIKNVRDVTNLDNKVEFYNNDFVFIPGAPSYTEGFIVSQDLETGVHFDNNKTFYNFNPNDLPKLITSPNKTLVFAHHPCIMSGSYAIDLAVHAIYNGKKITSLPAYEALLAGKAKPLLSHEGDAYLTQILSSLHVQRFFSGNIHEAATTTDTNSNPIPNGSFTNQLFANPGPAKLGDYGIIRINSNGSTALERDNILGNLKNYLAELTQNNAIQN